MSMRNNVWACAAYEAMRAWRKDAERLKTFKFFEFDETEFVKGFGDVVQMRYELELAPLLHGLDVFEDKLNKLMEALK